jgi:hypothetical protein
VHARRARVLVLADRRHRLPGPQAARRRGAQGGAAMTTTPDLLVRVNQTLRGPLFPGGEKHKWFVRSLRPSRRDGARTATLEGHLPGVGEQLVRTTLTVTFPGGKVDGEEWTIL